MRQRAHWPGLGWSGSLQVGQSSQAAGVVQAAQSGSVRVPETTAEWRPHAEQAADRRWQAGHQGWPVAREMPHGVVWPQIEQISSGSAGQREHSGPCGVRSLDSPAATAVDAGLQVRRVGDEAVRAQRPALVVAGDRFAAGSAACALLDAGVGDARAADPHVRRVACRCVRLGGSGGRPAGRSRRRRRRAAGRPASGSRAAARDGRPRSATLGGLPAPRPVSAGMRAEAPHGARRRRWFPGRRPGPARRSGCGSP